MAYHIILPLNLVQEAIRQTHSIWGGGLSIDDRMERQLQRLADCGTELYHLSGITDSDGRLVSSLKRYYFDISIDGEIVHAVGLGGIFTHPDYRRNGLAANMIEDILRESREELGCGASVLYSDIDPSYYNKLGFRQVTALSWDVPVASLPTAEVLERHEVIEGDLPLLLKLHDDATSSAGIRTERTEHTWKLFHQMNGIGSSQLLIDDKNEPVGYVTIGGEVKGGGIWLEEACSSIENESRLWATIRTIAEGMGATHMRGWYVPTLKLLTGFDGYEATLRTRAVPMIAALDSELVITDEALAHAYFPAPDHF